MSTPHPLGISSRLPAPCRDEAAVLQALLAGLAAGSGNGGALDWPAVINTARPWVQAVRDKPAPFWAMESLLREYPISSAEGLALMRQGLGMTAALLWQVGEQAARLPRRA